ncbi:MAG: carbamate kinase [Candidatus Marsarchaeota archaeon]|nr:carbamate kinase [Candidatus Marsarchaeota archaeon]
MRERYVIALGGNAISDHTLHKISYLIALENRKGNEIVITHGNGPQVGELASIENKNLAILTAQTQAEIGLNIETSLINADSSLENRVAVVLTRVYVDKNDPEFRNPSKPIGRFYNRKLKANIKNKEIVFKNLIHGYRRVVPSPYPLSIPELSLIENLLKKRYIVIACGGGGIPIFKSNNTKIMANAVIDKDAVSSLLASDLDADKFIILTNVDGAFLNFGKKNQKHIRTINYAQSDYYVSEKQFEEGSMLPKVKACMSFVKRTGKPASIGSINKPADAFRYKSTVITP